MDDYTSAYRFAYTFAHGSAVQAVAGIHEQAARALRAAAPVRSGNCHQRATKENDPVARRRAVIGSDGRRPTDSPVGLLTGGRGPEERQECTAPPARSRSAQADKSHPGNAPP